MASQTDFPDVLEHLDLGPLKVEVERVSDLPDHVDAVLRLWWEGPEDRWGRHSGRWGDPERRWNDYRGLEDLGWYEVEFKQGRSLREVKHAAWQLWERGPAPPPESRVHKVLVMPYLNRPALSLVREMGVNALDLCGNGILHGERCWFYQHGNPNRYTKRRSRAPYRGKSALVGRALLLNPWYEAVGHVREEIKYRGASISLSQVSKVLSALEDDLVVRKRGHGVRLLQPKKLLESLADAYEVPKPTETLEANANLGPELYRHLRERADEAGARIVGFDPQRYVIAPDARERLEVYVEPSIGSDLRGAFDLEPASRFANVIVRVVDEPGVFFDPEEADGFLWASPLEVYLQLMQGGKREKEIAGDLRESLLATAEASR